MIPFNRPYVPERSKQYAAEALESDHQQGDGPFTKKASEMLSELVGGGHVLLTPSCTHALEMASMLSNIGPGDEVILPSYTFTSAATAVTHFGATPVFVDIDPLTKCIDANEVSAAVTNKTRAISWVNYAGKAPDIASLQEIANDHGLLLIEDNAHGLGGSYRGLPLGSFGDFATQSFHSTKNIQCGEGGALIINNKDFIDRAEIIREKGTDRSKFKAGQVEKYQWVDKGSSYLLAELLAAVLLGQLEEFEEIQKKRNLIWDQYKIGFKDYLERTNMWSDHREVAHMFYIQISSQDKRDQLLNELRESLIQATFHYQPLNESLAGRQFARSIGFNAHSNHFAKTIVRLPLWHGLESEMVSKILSTTLNSKALKL